MNFLNDSREFLCSWNCKQLWVIPRSQSAYEYSESVWIDKPRFLPAAWCVPGSSFPTDSTLWIKRVMVDKSVDDLKTSQSIGGRRFPNFETFDAKIASALRKIFTNPYFKKRVNLVEHKAQMQNRFLRGRQIAKMIYEYFRVTGAHDAVLDHTDLFSVSQLGDDVQDFDTRWDQVLLFTSEVPKDNSILESLYKMWIRESGQLRNGNVRTRNQLRSIEAELPEVEDHGKEIHWPSDQNKELSCNERTETGVLVTQKGKNVSAERKSGECYQWIAKGQCSKGDKRGKKTQSSSLARPQTQKWRKKSFERKVLQRQWSFRRKKSKSLQELL